jgi:hypothetical protein
MNEKPNLMELMTQTMTGVSIAEQRIQERIRAEKAKRNQPKSTKKARKKK